MVKDGKPVLNIVGDPHDDETWRRARDIQDASAFLEERDERGPLADEDHHITCPMIWGADEDWGTDEELVCTCRPPVPRRRSGD